MGSISIQVSTTKEETKTFPLIERKFFDSVLLMLFAAFIGSYIIISNKALNLFLSMA